METRRHCYEDWCLPGSFRNAAWRQWHRARLRGETEADLEEMRLDQRSLDGQWLVGGLVAINFIFPLILRVCHHPNWLIFFRGVAQPPTRWTMLNMAMSGSDSLEVTAIYQADVRGLRKWRLLGGLEHLLLFQIGNFIIPTDFHTFQRGETTNQMRMVVSDGLTIKKWWFNSARKGWAWELMHWEWDYMGWDWDYSSHTSWIDLNNTSQETMACGPNHGRVSSHISSHCCGDHQLPSS